MSATFGSLFRSYLRGGGEAAIVLEGPPLPRLCPSAGSERDAGHSITCVYRLLPLDTLYYSFLPAPPLLPRVLPLVLPDHRNSFSGESRAQQSCRRRCDLSVLIDVSFAEPADDRRRHQILSFVVVLCLFLVQV